MNLGIKMEDLHICILLYADDIVLVSEHEQNLQRMLSQWQMKVNSEKTKIVHFQNKRRKTKFD